MANATYVLIDDYGNAAGNTVNGPVGGASALPIVGPFTAPSVAAAVTVAHICSTALQRPLRVVPVGSPPPYTLVVGLGPNANLTQVPSGIAY